MPISYRIDKTDISLRLLQSYTEFTIIEKVKNHLESDVGFKAVPADLENFCRVTTTSASLRSISSPYSAVASIIRTEAYGDRTTSSPDTA